MSIRDFTLLQATSKGKSMNNQKINWQLYKTSITAPDGVKLKATITYSKKMYSVHLKEPIEILTGGAQLPYGLPLMFVTTETSIRGVKSINLMERTNGTLLSLYTKHKSELNALDVKRLIADGYFHNDKALFENCCRAWNISDVDRIILKELV